MRILLVIILMAAVLISGCYGPEDKWEKALKSSDSEVRIEAAKELGKIGSARALTILSVSEDDPDRRVKEAVRNAIKKINAQTFLK